MNDDYHQKRVYSLRCAIQNGEFDDALQDIYDAILQRRKKLKQRLHSKDDLRVGDHVRITDSVRPQYLAGLTATIIKINRTRVHLEFHSGQELGRFEKHSYSACPISLIELIDQQPLNSLRKRKRRKIG